MVSESTLYVSQDGKDIANMQLLRINGVPALQMEGAVTSLLVADSMKVHAEAGKPDKDQHGTELRDGMAVDAIYLNTGAIDDLMELMTALPVISEDDPTMRLVYTNQDATVNFSLLCLPIVTDPDISKSVILWGINADGSAADCVVAVSGSQEL